jgi:hypothetical protein
MRRGKTEHHEIGKREERNQDAVRSFVSHSSERIIKYCCFDCMDGMGISFELAEERKSGDGSLWGKTGLWAGKWTSCIQVPSGRLLIVENTRTALMPNDRGSMQVEDSQSIEAVTYPCETVLMLGEHRDFL